ncbi:hypothetical protein CPB86DRAFT_788895 [Serendipita vermifera]|nr:hypothetical protein CPB86DRAFT_788895 [Serendipita vermifera]
MEAKLKGMKVADLKSVLQQANVAFDSKLTKPALIKKIMETPTAAEIVSKPDAMADDDDMPDLPPKIDWGDAPKTTTSAPISTPATQSATPSMSVPPTNVPPPTPATETPAVQAGSATSSPPKDKTESTFKADIPVASLEDEAAKRRARAAKWGTTYNDPTTVAPSTKKSPTTTTSTAKAPEGAELEKRKEREARFGKVASTSTSTTAQVDEEEIRKRKAREERFGPNKKPRVDSQ